MLIVSGNYPSTSNTEYNMSKKQYWKGLEELAPSAQFKEIEANEFREDLPFDGIESIAEANTSRRDFLKYLGFSTDAATIAAS